MAGYTRQSVADIIANAVIKAAPVNAEYNALRDAFAAASGHKHDGSTGEGANVPRIADADALNKVVVDTSNNRISFFTEVSSSAVEQIRLEDGVLKPVSDDDIDLGATGAEFKNLYIDGIGYIDSVVITGGTIDGAVIGGTTPAAGTFTSLVATTADINGGTVDGAVVGGNSAAAGSFTTLAASSNAAVGGTFAVTGTSALTGTTTITSADINSGAMDNTTIGNTTAAAGTFTDLTASGTTTITTADINGGAIDGVTIGGSSAGAGTFTDLTSTGTSTHATVDINGGAVDGTTIGASSASSGSFTTVATSGQATLATVDINGGTIDAAVIGGSTPAAITGTTVTANTNFVGNITGNVTGNISGDVTGDVAGDLTGNVTAGSGTSSFTNVTINGSLNMNAGTSATITNLTAPSSDLDAATKLYVDTEVAGLVDSAPGTLNTLNELAAALGDDADFSTTITNSIATKLPLAGGTMSGAIAMGTSKITGLGDPTANQDAATKKYTTDTFLPLAGGTLTGALAVGSNKITASYTPSASADLTTKTYVDGILGSATAASTSASAAASSATAAASSATASASSATGAASSATSAAASFDSFDDRYLGAKSSAPSVDNDGDALVTGALYFNSTTNIMNVRTSGGSWTAAGSSVNGTSSRNTYTATANQTTFAATYDSGFVDVFMNGLKLKSGTDFTATSGTSIVLASGATVGDIIDIVAYGTFTLADHLSQTQSDARYLLESNNLSDLDSASTARTNLGVAIGSNVQAYDAGLTSIAGLTTAADKIIFTSGSDTYAVTDFSSFARTLVDDADASAARTTLGVAIGTNVLAYDANLPTFPSGITTTEVGYLDGVTSAIQTQLDTKAPTASPTFTTKATIDGTLDIEEVYEKVTVQTSTTGTITFDTTAQAVELYTANQGGNRTINFTNVNSNLAIGQSLTVSIAMTQGSTAYYLNAYQVDSSSVTPKWSGGTAPTGGNASSIDAYSFTIIKTADATFTVLASQTQFA